jgi:uncharacterized protein
MARPPACRSQQGKWIDKSREENEMTHPNEEKIKAIYADMGAGSLRLVQDFMADGIKWTITGTSPVSGTYTGKEEVIGFYTRMLELYQGTFKIEIRDVLANDESGVVLATESATVGGETLEFTSVHLWSLSNGKCVSFISYEDDDYHQFWAR